MGSLQEQVRGQGLVCQGGGVAQAVLSLLLGRCVWPPHRPSMQIEKLRARESAMLLSAIAPGAACV